jgi:nucleotide-binding universal stress UspA family protein
VAGAEQLRAGDSGQADRSGADHGGDIAGAHAAGQHADLVTGGQDVTQHQDFLLTDAVGHPEGGEIGVGHADALGLGTVDLVAEDPPALLKALEWAMKEAAICHAPLTVLTVD